MRKLFFVSFSIFMVTSCQLAICTWNSGYTVVNTNPYHEKVKGLYSLNAGSSKFLAEQGCIVDSFKLELKNDGFFVINRIPQIVFKSFETSQANYTTKKGRWSVSCEASDGCLMELEGVCVEPFLEKDDKFAISITIGDPDECQGIIFEKVE